MSQEKEDGVATLFEELKDTLQTQGRKAADLLLNTLHEGGQISAEQYANWAEALGIGGTTLAYVAEGPWAVLKLAS